MTNKRLYEIMDELNMVDENDNQEDFVENANKDFLYTLDFVENLCLYNDLETIKKLLIAIIMENK